MTIYPKPLWKIMQDEALMEKELPEPFSSAEAIDWFRKHYPKFNPKSVRAHLRAMSANDPTKQHHPSLPHDVLLKIGRSEYRRYEPDRDGLFDNQGRSEGEADDYEEDDLQSEDELAAFALERHLEEFLEANWSRIDFGQSLRLYESTDGHSGRQFPTAVGNIDFLCEDTSSGDLVVIELKKGRSSDKVLGQCQRYMGWVLEHLAKPGQKVRGLIIAPEQHERLQYALKVAPNVNMLCYRLDFQLVKPSEAAND